MRQAEFAPNHTVDPKTGFVESKAYPYAFDAEKKALFLKMYREKGRGIYGTCELLGISRNTVIKHYQTDPVFKQAYDDLEAEYASKLEAISRQNALKSKSVIERIFQLKSLSKKGLTQGKYDENSVSAPHITLNIDANLLSKIRDREKLIDAEIVPQISDEKSDT